MCGLLPAADRDTVPQIGTSAASREQPQRRWLSEVPNCHNVTSWSLGSRPGSTSVRVGNENDLHTLEKLLGCKNA